MLYYTNKETSDENTVVTYYEIIYFKNWSCIQVLNQI